MILVHVLLDIFQDYQRQLTTIELLLHRIGFQPYDSFQSHREESLLILPIDEKSKQLELIISQKNEWKISLDYIGKSNDKQLGDTMIVYKQRKEIGEVDRCGLFTGLFEQMLLHIVVSLQIVGGFV